MNETGCVEYRLAKGWKVFLWLSMPCMFTLFLYLCFLPWLDDKGTSTTRVSFCLILGIAGCSFFAYAFLATFLTKLVIKRDVIEDHGIFRVKKVALTDIVGFSGNGENIFLIGKNNKKAMSIGCYMERKPEFLQWLHSNFTDLHAVEIEEELNNEFLI